MSLVDEINKLVGKDIAAMGRDVANKDVEAISTGLLALDNVLGCGGFPKGRVVEIHGNFSSGKSALCLSFIGRSQKEGFKCAYIDAEYSFNFDFARNLGVNTDELLLIQPDCGEEAFEAMEKLIRSKDIQVFVVDSVSGLLPKPSAEAEVGKEMIGAQAKLVRSGLSKIIGPMAKTGAIVIFINQLRVNIMGGRYDPWTLPGGMALRFYSTIMLELHKDKAIMSSDRITGYNIHVKVKKNKVGPPAGECDLALHFDTGFSSEASLLSIAEELGVVEKRGRSLYFKDELLGTSLALAEKKLFENPEIGLRIKAELSTAN